MEQNHEKSPKCVNTAELMEDITKREKDVCIFDDRKFDEIMQEDLMIRTISVVNWIDAQIHKKNFTKVDDRIEITDLKELVELGLFENDIIKEVRKVFTLRKLSLQAYTGRDAYKFIFKKLVLKEE